MDWPVIFKVLHVAGMFAAVSLLVGGMVYSEAVLRTRERSVIRLAHTGFVRLERLGIGLVVVAIVFGLTTAVLFGFDLLRPWLVVAYVSVAALFVLGPLTTARFERVARIASGEDAGATDLDAAIGDTRRLLMEIATVALYAGIIADMVVKPFS